MIRYTKKTRAILNFIDDYGFITAKICANMFYKGNKYAITQARNTLGNIVKNGDIVANTHPDYGKELLYQFSKKSISKHSYHILSLIGELNLIVDKIDSVKFEQRWMGGARRTDAMIEVSLTHESNHFTRFYFVECDYTHKTDKDKYLEIYSSEEPQKIYGYFPDVIQISYSGKPSIEGNEDYSVIGLDYNFTNLASKILLG